MTTKNILQKLLKNLNRFIEEQYKYNHQKYLISQQAVDAQNQQMYIHQLQYELTVVLHNYSYSRLKSVDSEKHLRFKGVLPQGQNGRLYYIFTLQKVSVDEIASVICDNIRDEMNNDIWDFWNEQSAYHTAMEMQVMYPILFHNGIHILHVEDWRDHVRIIVVA